MSTRLSDEFLEYLVNLPDSEFASYIDIPDGDISDVGDEDVNENDISVEIGNNISQGQTEAAVMDLVHMVEKQKERDEIVTVTNGDEDQQHETLDEQVIKF